MKKTAFAVAATLALGAPAAFAVGGDFEDYARVTNVTPEYDRVNTPRKECYSETVPEYRERHGLVGPLIGGVAGGKADVDLYHILRKRLHVIGTVMRARSLQEKIATASAFAEEVVPLLANEAVQPVIDSVFPLEKVQDAHRRLESNGTFGKVVLTIP